MSNSPGYVTADAFKITRRWFRRISLFIFELAKKYSDFRPTTFRSQIQRPTATAPPIY